MTAVTAPAAPVRARVSTSIVRFVAEVPAGPPGVHVTVMPEAASATSMREASSRVTLAGPLAQARAAISGAARGERDDAGLGGVDEGVDAGG